MITNPTVGMMVLYVNRMAPAWHHRRGVIDAMAPRGDDNHVWVVFDEEISGGRRWQCRIDHLQKYPSTPEEMDKQRREEHAEKYL